jgi:hypothetical protein
LPDKFKETANTGIGASHIRYQESPLKPQDKYQQIPERIKEGAIHFIISDSGFCWSFIGMLLMFGKDNYLIKGKAPGFLTPGGLSNPKTLKS